MVIVLLENGYQVTIFDDLSNACEEVYPRLKVIAGDKADDMRFIKVCYIHPTENGGGEWYINVIHRIFHQVALPLCSLTQPPQQGDLKSVADLEAAFKGVKYEAVIHFAGRKYVGESVSQPFLYYDNNLKGTINLIQVMSQHGCKNVRTLLLFPSLYMLQTCTLIHPNKQQLVFSSSCTVYGNPEYVPLDEKHRLQAVSPYGRTKLMIEDMFRDIAAADSEWRIVLLRYFNPVGAHHTGLIGEEQKGIPNNLMPYVQQVIQGRRPFLSVFGSDYNTRDGTCIRDYVHVVDLAEGHVAAMKKLWDTPDIGCKAFNLGTGVGTTVLELIKVIAIYGKCM